MCILAFFILTLTESAEIRELKDEEAKMHIVHPSCCHPSAH